MKPQTRQTLIGVTGLTIVECVALTQDYNGLVLITYMSAVMALVSPQALEHWVDSPPVGDR